MISEEVMALVSRGLWNYILLIKILYQSLKNWLAVFLSSSALAALSPPPPFSGSTDDMLYQYTATWARRRSRIECPHPLDSSIYLYQTTPSAIMMQRCGGSGLVHV